MHEAFLEELTAKAAADPRIHAAWLAGSFGRGEADRYSDVDLHLLLDDDAAEAFKADVEAWLSSVRPLVLFRWLFGNYLVNALTEEGLRVDLVPHVGASISLDPQKVRVLFQRDAAIQLDLAAEGSSATPGRPERADPATTAQTLLGQAQEFWRCLALLPTVIGRDELIVGVAGLTIEVKILTDFLILGNGIPRESGANRLNGFLPGALQQRLEELLSIAPLTRQRLADAHLGLAGIMREHGPPIAAQHGFRYPDELECTVRAYVRNELAGLGLADATAAPANGA